MEAVAGRKMVKAVEGGEADDRRSVERVLGKDEVKGPSPFSSSSCFVEYLEKPWMR